MPTASASDVRVEIDVSSSLDNTDIEAIIQRIERDIERELDAPPATGSDDRKDLEAVLAAHFIATTRDRAEEEVSTGRTSVTYEEGLVKQLRSRARRLGATDALLGINADKPTAGFGVLDSRGLSE